VKGEFVGGCDIVRDMYTSGELTPIVDKALDRQTAEAD
jgi:glutaredoxin-related protein